MLCVRVSRGDAAPRLVGWMRNGDKSDGVFEMYEVPQTSVTASFVSECR